MPNRDYLMRLIEEALQVIMRITLQRNAGQPDEALASVVDAMGKLFGMPAEDFGALDADGIFAQLTREESAENARDKCLIFAALNNQAGLAYEEKDLPALAQPAFHLALLFTLKALETYPGGAPPAIAPDIGTLLGKLGGFELPERTRELLEARRAPGRRHGA